MNEEYYRLLGELQAIDFVLVELNLYLDTHPHDTQAIHQYNQYSHQSQELKKKFESRFGPLQNFGNSPMEPGKLWNQPPWPWQV
ncbi:spore coat protein CotJB [Kroppenstedtia pulmonis]|uniref:Spore coat protein CotJB n=1 Tax=Kroppenstedtia pulmonis TaxID=1380685 RepID=A0A7D4BWU0_9BACL|nr:spore coat protein CotJB [Kroppenstedtia pulmonis]QKG85133.1 spore coat protein CotJB [Kroppenstedtia pulmonis]